MVARGLADVDVDAVVIGTEQVARDHRAGAGRDVGDGRAREDDREGRRRGRGGRLLVADVGDERRDGLDQDGDLGVGVLVADVVVGGGDRRRALVGDGGAGVLVVQTNERSQTDREDGSGTEKLSDQVDLLFFVGLTMGRSYHIGSIFVKSGEYKIKRTFSERVPLKAFGAPSWSAILTELG